MVLVLIPLLALMVGSLLLHGVQRTLGLQPALLVQDRGIIAFQLQAQGALSWGKTLNWEPQDHWQCRPVPDGEGRSCLRLVGNGDVLLAGQAGHREHHNGVVFWLRGRISAGQIAFLPGGWSDFCPVQGDTCRLP